VLKNRLRSFLKNLARPINLFIVHLLLASNSALAETHSTPVPVRVVKFSELAMPIKKSAPAIVISLNDSTISAEISAPIAEIHHNVGEAVDKNSVLAELLCNDYHIAYRQQVAMQKRLQSKKILAEQRLRRARKLEHARNISAEQLDQRKAELDTLLAQQEEQKAVVELAQRTITKCDIRAPFKGVIIHRLAQTGAITMPDQPMFQLLDTDNIEVSARIRPTSIKGLQSAKSIEFEFGGVPYPLVLRAIVPSIDTRSRDQEVRLTFTGPKALPGLRGRLEWQSLQRALPKHIFVHRKKQMGVFIAKNGYAHFIPVKDALAGRKSTASFPADTAIIVEGHAGLLDGDSVSLK